MVHLVLLVDENCTNTLHLSPFKSSSQRGNRCVVVSRAR